MSHALLFACSVILDVYIVYSYEIVASIWNDSFVFDEEGNGGWKDIGNYCKDDTTCLDDNPVTNGSLNRYHGPYRAFGGDGFSPQHYLSQLFYCQYPSDVTVKYKVASCAADSDDYYRFYFDDSQIEGIERDINGIALDDDILKDECSSWQYIDRTWTNIGSVLSNQSFEPKWGFTMNAVDYYVVYDIQIICDGTANPSSDPTITPSVDPSRHPSKVPTADPSVYPTDDPTIPTTKTPSFYPSNDPTSDPTSNPTISATVDPSTTPTENPSILPSSSPTNTLSRSPTIQPTKRPMLSSQITAVNNPPTQSPTASNEGVVDQQTTDFDEDENISKDTDENDDTLPTIVYTISILGGSIFLCLLCLALKLIKRKRRRKQASIRLT